MALVFIACNVDVSNVGDVFEAGSKGERNGSVGFRDNAPNSLSGAGFGRPIQNNPNQILGNVTPPIDQRSVITQADVFITDNNRLEFDCELGSPFNGVVISDCLEVRQTALSGYTAPNQGTWGYAPNTAEFLEVSTFYNSRVSVEDFLTRQVTSKAITGTAVDNDTSIPTTYLTTTPSFWFSSDNPETPTLKVLSHCTRPTKPAFYSSSFEICMGPADNITDGFGNTPFSSFNYSEDLTILNHELGHVFSYTMFNQRNLAAGTALGIDRRVTFGGDFYSEIDAISEGFSDWYAYLRSNRLEVFDWIGTILPSVRRPVSETSELHPNFVTDDSTSRVKYPDFLTFDTSDVSTPVEDTHFGGQIISHFLVHMEDEIESICGVSDSGAKEIIFQLVQETLAELGDLTSNGRDSSAVDRINLIEEASTEWVTKNAPPNFRSFSQGFARHFLRIVNSTAVCNNVNFGQDRLEQILDQHGLLLFKTYNEDGSNAATGHAGANTSVTSLNRVNSVLLPKSALKIDDRSGQPSQGYYILDDPSVLANILNELQSAGKTTIDQRGNSNLVSVANSNKNSKVSPGEVIAVALNLYNDSNVTMGGIQVLANDWDHVKVDGGETKMCNTFEDAFPSLSQNGAPADPVVPTDGDCGFITQENGLQLTEANETVAPICFIRKPGAQTSWVSQEEYKEFTSTVDADCLMGGDNRNECFFRPIPGADIAWYSKIDANKNWPETFDPATAAAPTFTAGNVLLFEVSEKLPPGTTVNCRLRARFTNCDDCWHDSANGDDDYLDYEYAGADPFRVFNIQFLVLE